MYTFEELQQYMGVVFIRRPPFFARSRIGNARGGVRPPSMEGGGGGGGGGGGEV
jgi:hypothetical protein